MSTDYPALYECTMQVVKDMYEAYANGKSSQQQFYQDCNESNVTNRVTAAIGPDSPLTEEDKLSILAILWQQVGLGIIVPRSIGYNGTFFFRVTQYGQAVLAGIDNGPYDPFGYLRRLDDLAPKLETETKSCVREAITCFQAQCFRASAVMLGLASEIEIERLIAIVPCKLAPVQQTELERGLAKARNMKAKFECLLNALKSLGSDLPITVGEVDTWLNGTFQTIRVTRNDAGHPIGGAPTREVVYGQLSQFPTYAKYLSELKVFLLS